MEDFDEVEQAWSELQEVPSYFERFNPHSPVHLIIVQHCESCGNWHNADDRCTLVLLEV